MSSPCSMDSMCANGETWQGDLAKCAYCRFSPENVGHKMTHYWQPVEIRSENGKKITHPLLIKEKRDKKFSLHIEKLSKKRNRDKSKITISRKAQQAERVTERNIIKATKNSGRSNRDGDHTLFNSITLDTKLQTNNENPIVRLEQLDKVRQDAAKAGKVAGGLILRNKHGVGVVVFKEEDIPKVINGYGS